MVLLSLILQDTLCYWFYISSFSSPEENNFNAVCIGEFQRFFYRIYSQSPPLKYWTKKKVFMWEKPFWANLWRVVLLGGTNDRIMQRYGGFHKCIF